VNLPNILLTAAAALHAWLSPDTGGGSYTLRAVPFDLLDEFMEGNPEAMTAQAVIRQLEAAGEYESGDALQRAVWEMERTHPGYVPVCTR
jgi:hypothetical protein